MDQPDFTEIFFNHFGGKPKEVHYELRLMPNFLHDLAFLSSLIHDSIFLYGDISHQNGELVIPIFRICWEIPKTKNYELHSTNSELTFTTVQNLKWSFNNSNKPAPSDEFEISHLFVGEDIREHNKDTFRFLVSGVDWKISFDLDQYDFSVSLKDKEKPKLTT